MYTSSIANHLKRTESIADRFFAAISARNRRSLSSIFLIIFLSLGSIGLHAQTTFGTFLGTVQDQSGAVIANATVTMLNLGTAATRTVHTEADGTYNFVNVEPGNYKLSVEAKGFKRAIFSLTLAARQSIRVDASLQVGAQDQSVEVHGSFTVINTDVSNLAETKTGLELIDLPVAITSRGSGSTSPYSTLTMQPGIQTDNAGNISVSGAKPGTLSISIDGISTMDPRLSTPLTELFPSFNAIAEIRVGSVNNSAEYGGVSDITTTSKGGSNTLQGGVFEINQEADYDAKSPFALKKPSLIMNDFGGFIGGPVVFPHLYNGHKRTFFFVSYEGLRLPQQTTITDSVPSNALRSGDLSVYTGTIKNPSTGLPFTNNLITPINTLSAKMLTYLYPQANTGAANAIANNYTTNVPTPVHSNQADIRLDQNFSSRQSGFARFTYKRRVADKVSSGTPLAGPTVVPEHDFALTLGHNFIISPALVNELRAGWTENKTSTGFGILASTIASELGLQLPGPVPQGNVVPGLSITGFQGTADSNSSNSRGETIQGFDNLTYQRGRHTVKFGGDIRHLESYNDNNWANYRLGTYAFNGSVTNSIIGNPFAAFLLGVPDSTSVATVTATDTNGHAFHFTTYAQDDWRVTHRLTLNFGIRWEYHPGYVDGHNDTANLLPDYYSVVNGTTVHGAVVVPDARINSVNSVFAGAISPTPFVTASSQGMPQNLRYSQKTDFSPRVGFAWSLNDKTVLRGGYGKYIETELGLLLYAGYGVPGGYTGAFTNTIVSGQPTLTFPYPFPPVLSVASGTAQFLAAADTHYKDPFIQQWNLTIERNLGANIGLRLSYDGNRSSNMGGGEDLNELPANTVGYAALASQRPYPLWSNIRVDTSTAKGSYNAFTASVNRRLYKGLQFESSYIFAKNLSNGAGWDPTSFESEVGLLVFDRFNPQHDYGNVVFTRRQRSLSTFLYDLPIGRGHSLLGEAGPVLDRVVGKWEVAGVVLFQTGPFLTVITSGTDPAGTNEPNFIGGLRADLVSGQPLYPAVKNSHQWLNPAAFATPANNIGRDPNSPVGVVNGPGTQAVSLSLFKTVAINERFRLQVGGAAANVFNHRNFGIPALKVSVPASFGTITTLQTTEGAGPRAVQLTARINF